MEKQTFSLGEVIRVAEAATRLGRLEGKQAFLALWERSDLKTESLRWLMSHPAYFHPLVAEVDVPGALSEAQGEEIMQSVFGESVT